MLVSSASYFSEVVQSAMEKRGFAASPLASQYIVGLLDSYVLAENVPLTTSLAETMLKAVQAERKTRHEMLKRLGDVSLYISGFFGDSLNRKIVDIDYYAEMGGVAYGQLAKELEPDFKAEVYGEFSTHFVDFVDLLTYISQSSLVQSNRDLLRLCDRYVKTGSELAKEQLLENGLLTVDAMREQLKKVNNQ